MNHCVTILLFVFHPGFVICGSLLIWRHLRYRFLPPVILLTFFPI